MTGNYNDKKKTAITRNICTFTRIKTFLSLVTVVTTMQGKNKKSLAYNLKVREALEIRRHNSGAGKGLNEEMGAYVKTDMWDPVLHTMD